MGGGQAGAELPGDLHRLVAGKAADAPQQHRQVLAVHVLHGDEVLTVHLTDVVDPAHVGMSDLPRVADLLQEAGKPVRGLGEQLGPRRAEIVTNLKSQGVGSSVYYPGPVPHLTYYRLKYGFGEGDYPVARSISDRSIALPVGPHLDPDDMAYIVNAMKQAMHDAR